MREKTANNTTFKISAVDITAQQKPRTMTSSNNLLHSFIFERSDVHELFGNGALH